MLEKLPVCLVNSNKYLSDYFAPARKIRKDFSCCAFFVRLPNSAKVHIVTTVNAVISSSFIFLDIYEGEGKWLRCRASVKNAYGSINMAILEVSDPDNTKNARFMSIAEQRALPLFSNTIDYHTLLTARVYSFVLTKEQSMQCKLIFQSLVDRRLEFSHQVYMTLAYSTDTELAFGVPCIAVVNEQPVILGMHLTHDNNLGYGLPWLLLNVILQADLQNLAIKGIGSPLIHLQPLENNLDRVCNGLKDYSYGARVRTVHPQSALAPHIQVGDVLLKINGDEVSPQKLIYDKRLRCDFRFSLMTFNAAMPNATIELEFGRRQVVDVQKGEYGLKIFTVKVMNDRTMDDIMADKNCKDYSLLVISGFQFLSVSRYKFADHQEYVDGQDAFFKTRLEYVATDTCQQLVVLGELPGVYEAEHYEKYRGCKVTQVDGKSILDFERFKKAVEDNLKSGTEGVTITLTRVEDESSLLLRENELGSDIYIKHQTFERNEEFSQKMNIPFQFFATPPKREQEDLRRKPTSPEIRM